MDFKPTENQTFIKDSVKKFAEENILPKFMEWDETQEFPLELFKKMGEAGLMGIIIPEEFGGVGMNYHEYVTSIVEIAKVCGSIGLSMAAHNSLCSNHILTFGSQEQKEKYLPNLATAKSIGAWGLTEHNTGSDAGNMNATAKKDGDYWILNGSKNFITHAISGDIAVVIFRTGERRVPNNTSAFIIEKGTSGFNSGKKENKLGMRASETAELIFDNCKIHNSQLLGNVGEGFKQAMKILDGGRISIAALSLGIAKGALNAAIKYSKEREQFGKKIADFQAISFKLADMFTEVEAAELLIHQAAYLKNNDLPVTEKSAIAKYYASEVAVRTATEAVQIFGGYGYTKDFPAEKFYRDAKLCTIGEGTSEIQKLVISRSILN